jgi:hypothetical protein
MHGMYNFKITEFYTKDRSYNYNYKISHQSRILVGPAAQSV